MMLITFIIFVLFIQSSISNEKAISEELWKELLDHPNRKHEITRKNVYGKMSKKDARKRNGALLPEGVEEPRHVKKTKTKRRSSLPDSYTIYDEFPECDYAAPQDQGTCGNCWIVGVVNAAKDRYCFQAARAGLKNFTKYHASIQSLTSCYNQQHNLIPGMSGDNVCGGGFVRRAMKAMTVTCDNDPGYHCGVVHTSCFEYRPYSTGTTVMPCPVEPTSCPDTAITGWGNWSNDRMYLSGYRKYNEGPGDIMQNNAEEIKKEIYENGPVVFQHKVYSDMYAYGGGTYTHIGGTFEGYHAVDVIGWGKFGATQWWVVKGSWGNDWGITVGNYRGYINVKFGEVGMEDFPQAPEVIICNPTCKNNGTCVGQNDCDCTGTGYEGNDCSIPYCSKGCANHGSCIHPEVCDCSDFYHGETCKEFCQPVVNQKIFFSEL